MRFALELKSAAVTVEHFAAPFEVKFANGGQPGEFEGYASVFGNVDQHGDKMMPGAFAASIAEHKARNTLPVLYINHGPAHGGEVLPAGKLVDWSEDSNGLQVKGKVSALDTDRGKLIRGLMQDGALSGMSIGYQAVKKDYHKAAPDGLRRTLREVRVHEISLVPNPSNLLANVREVKAGDAFTPDTETATDRLAKAIKLHDKSMSSGYYDSGSSKDRAVLMDHLMAVHHALTGDRVPDGVDGWAKAADMTIDDLEKVARESGLSATEAKSFAVRFAASLQPRRDGAASTDPLAALASVAAGLSNLPKFGG